MVKDSRIPQGRGIWKGIQQQKIMVEDMSSLEVRNEKQIYFWWDKWKDNQSLKCRFPQIYIISTQKNESLNDMVEYNSWNI